MSWSHACQQARVWPLPQSLQHGLRPCLQSHRRGTRQASPDLGEEPAKGDPHYFSAWRSCKPGRRDRAPRCKGQPCLFPAPKFDDGWRPDQETVKKMSCYPAPSPSTHHFAHPNTKEGLARRDVRDENPHGLPCKLCNWNEETGAGIILSPNHHLQGS